MSVKMTEADRREMYGVGKGMEKASVMLRTAAVELFLGGDDTEAALLRVQARRLAVQSDLLLDEWRKAAKEAS